MTWIIEDTAFSGGDVLLPALKKLDKDIILWNDGQYKDFPEKSIFHGSLENAFRLNKAKLPNIISLCNEEHFSYSNIFKNYSDYLLSQHPIFTTIAELMNNHSILNRITTEFFLLARTVRKKRSAVVCSVKLI